MGKIANSCLLLLMCSILCAQTNLRFGEWESHLPYQRGLSITQSPTKVYFGTDFSIMSVEKEDNSLEFISKVEGLSTVGISDLKYDQASGNILIAYLNNDIDIMTPEGVVNVPDIKNNLGIIGDKRINGIHFDDTKTAYLSTGFGVVSYDMENLEFGFTTQMGLRVLNATTDDNNILYAATEEGIYSLDLNRNFNFGDFANWNFLGNEVGLPMLYEANEIAFYEGNLWMISDNKVWLKEGDLFEIKLEAEGGEVFQFLSVEGPELMIGSQFSGDFQSKITYVNESLEITTGLVGCSNFIEDAVMEDSGKIWYADEWRGFRFTRDKEGDCLKVVNRSPLSHSVSELLVDDGVLYAVSGGVTDGFGFQSNRDGIYILEDGAWTNYNETNVAAIKSEEFINIFEIAKRPGEQKLYLGSFFAGLMEADFETNEFTTHNSTNSPILGSPGVEDIEKVAGLAFDQNNVLWISAHDAEKPLVAMSEEGVFHSFDINANSRIGHITVDNSGNKWIQVTGTSGGVLVYKDNEDIRDPSIHEQRFINSSNSEMTSSVVNCITTDLDGTVWVGTGAGPVIFGCDPFQKDNDGFFNCNGNTKTVLEDSIPAILLITEDIRAIAVDGGNQKWFGTRNGIFVQSPDGGDKIARFTTENSPLFSDNIIDLEFDPKTGKMYIASDNGIQAYQTITTGGNKFHQSEVYAFPNPVRPEFEGLIAFKGLARDATIKVTDINGQLVHESSALGGQATWDGRDYSGREVASGVYLVFSNSTDSSGIEDPNTAVTKVLIVR